MKILSLAVLLLCLVCAVICAETEFKAPGVQHFGIDIPFEKIALARADETEDYQELSDLSSGVTLQATASLNVRSGPCTDRSIVTTLGSGSMVKFTGDVKSACGYTWYSVSTSAGSGYAASSWLKEVSSNTGGTSGSGSSCRQSYNYPLFKQCDSRWGSNGLGSSSTICKVGCLMTSVCSALNGRGKSSMNPGQLNTWLKSNGGYYGNLFVWGSVSKFGFSYLGQSESKTQIVNWLCQGKVVIGNVRNGGHWVLLKAYNNGVFEVNDSGYSVSSYTSGEVVRAAAFSA